MHNPFLLNNLASQGFRHILFNNPEQKKEYAQPACTPDKKTVLQKNRRPDETFRADSVSSVPPRPSSASVSKTTSQTAVFSSSPLRQNAGQKPPKTEITLPSPNPVRPPVLPFHAWPEEWKFIHRRCQLPPERPKHLSKQIVWTYAGLEYDLFTDKPSDKRRKLIAQIIKTLSFPKGTHIFLPYRTISRDGTSQIAALNAGNADYSFFWSAIDFIRPRVLIVFGEQSIEELNLPPLLPTQKHTLAPVTVYALDTIMLYAENSKENEIMMNFLKSNLKVFA